MKNQIIELLKKGNTLSMTNRSGGQGGEIYSVYLNDEEIGEKYINGKKIRKGSESEVKLAEDIKDWGHCEFVDFLSDNDFWFTTYESKFSLSKNKLVVAIYGESYEPEYDEEDSDSITMYI